MRLVVAYDGGPFSGFARQRDRRTVQGELEAALGRLAKGPVTTVGAGRTDAGVHARGQVVHADVPAGLDPERVRRALNGGLGPAITVREAAWAPDGFDARLSARRRTYVYRVDDAGDPDPLLRGFVLSWPRPLDLPRMREAARPLLGEHDFAAFCRSRPGTTTTRRLRSLGIRRVRGLVEVRLVADAFCWQMVRGIVGHLLLVGDGRRDPARHGRRAGRGRPLPRRQHRPTPRPGAGGRLLPERPEAAAPGLMTGGSSSAGCGRRSR